MDTPNNPTPVPGQLTLEEAPAVELAALARDLVEATKQAQDGALLIAFANARLSYVAGAFERLSEDELDPGDGGCHCYGCPSWSHYVAIREADMSTNVPESV